jgi:hypothetical protein
VRVTHLANRDVHATVEVHTARSSRSAQRPRATNSPPVFNMTPSLSPVPCFALRFHRAMVVAALTAVVAGDKIAAQTQSTAPQPEVRQLVTFLFQPGRSTDAMTIYEQKLKPIYTDVAPLLRFRAFREAESPEPLDLMVMSSYAGMAGMDLANDALRRPNASGQSATSLYGTLSGLTQTHHDQFVEMLPALSDTATDAATLTVFEYIRVTPGRQALYERGLLNEVRPFERTNRLYDWSETGRMLVSDGWDYLRIFGVKSLGDWHRYKRGTRGQGFQFAADTVVAARKTIILRRESRLSVR